MNKILIFLVVIAFACQNNSRSSTSNEHSMLEVQWPQDTIRWGQAIDIAFMGGVDGDSIIIILNNIRLGSTNIASPFTIQPSNTILGRNLLLVRVYKNGKTIDYPSHFTCYSDIVPVNYTFKVLEKYPHDRGAYTQGLLWDKGRVFESTGMWGQSSLREIELKTGKVIQSKPLASSIFAEGLTLVNDRLVQITYKSKQGYVYDKETFSLIKTFYYPMAEGWGLCFNGKDLIMTEGTNKLYYLDSATFEVKQVKEVYDHQNPIMYINEMEYVNGLIYANIYGSDDIVVIDEPTARVVKRINARGILPEMLKKPDTDVFNGIAYDPTNNTFLVTGKNWPLLFRVQWVKN